MEKVKCFGSLPSLAAYERRLGMHRARHFETEFKEMESSACLTYGFRKRSKTAAANSSKSFGGSSSVGITSP